MPAPIPTDAVRTQSERKASPTARGPWPRSQSETTPTTTRNGVALNGRTPANPAARIDRKSTRLNSSHDQISYAVFCLKKKKRQDTSERLQGITTAPRHSPIGPCVSAAPIWGVDLQNISHQKCLDLMQIQTCMLNTNV